MDLMRPMQVESLVGKRYAYLIVDDYTIFTWVKFIKEKYEVFEVFKELCHKIQREKDYGVVRIRSDHGKEFENKDFESFFNDRGILHDFSCPRNPQQNGVVE